MPGKSYTIREMKNIVDYLTANKLYSEIRGRKMWMDYANSKHTTRTWQSLKETFLKRILTDLHNPYYKLNMEQVESFRAGYDLVERNKNKLEIHSVSDDSNSNGPNQMVTPQTNNGNGIKEENTAGENIKPSKIPSRSRSSADTVIVETCYETAEDIQKDLESPTGEKENGGTKSLRDCITYSEPLTPMLQEVLDDFQSEPENDPEVSEIEMIHSELTENSVNLLQVVSNTNNETEKSKHVDNADPEKGTDSASVSDKKVKEKQANEPEPAQKIQDSATVDKSSEIVCLDDSPTEDNDELKNVEEDTFHQIKNDTDKLGKITVESNTENTEIVEVPDSSQNAILIPHSGAIPNSNSTTDVSLPNNPEALNKRISDEKQDDKITSLQKKIDSKGTIRKRSNSENIVKVIENKKTKLEKNKNKSTSETEGNRTDDTTAKIKPHKAEQKGGSTKEDSISSSKDEANNSKIAPSLAKILEKPSTSLADDVNQFLLSDTEQGGKVNESSEIINPCLQNVSLFEEQINKKKYNISEESSLMEQKRKNEVTEGKKEKDKQKENEIVMLKSHSESDTEESPTPPKKKHRAGVSMSKKDRDRALANVFGFASGTSQSKRKRQLSHRKRTISHNNISHNNGGSNSSEWTSESDSDMYVLPPRGRKNRQTKKYLKPQSGRIFSLEEEGGLFVMYGKKIYPLVKDGKLVKNYLHYMPESDSEEEKNFWKLKYVAEKKKANELKKLLEQAKEPHAGQSTSSDIQPNPLRNSTSYQNLPQATSSNTEMCIPVRDERKDLAKATVPESIKIKFTTKNDQEIHLEGNWPQIHNVLEHVVHIFHKEPQPVSEYKPKTIVEPPSSSGISTPVVITAVQEPGVDPEVHEKVNKIESEIFKEIEERDKEEQNQPSSNGQDSNITKRRAGRPRKSSQSSAPQSPAKRQKISDQQDSEVNSTNSKGNDNENNEGNKRQSRASSRTILNESPSSNDARFIQTRRSKLNLDTNLSGKANEDEEVRYMFPPKNRRPNTKSATDKNTRDKPQKSTAKPPTIYSSPETVCPNSMESTLGYQDSDPTPIRVDLRKKKLMNQSVLKSKSKSHLRRSSRKKLQSYLYSDDTVNSRVEAPINKTERDNSTLNTSVYRSDSYQLLMSQAKASLRQAKPLLEQIDESSSIENEVDFIQHLDSTAKNEIFSVQMTSNYNERISGLVSSDVGSSSNVSLPISPELSIVERMSVSKELLEHGSMLNEIQSKETIVPMSCSQFLMSNIDVSVPLMQQECGLKSCNASEEINHEPKSVVTESLFSKIGTFNIEDQPNLTDTLDAKLRDLLLESAKKIAIENIQNKENNNMDVDIEVEKKVKNKKISSTPRKRKNSHKSKKVPKVHTVVEEEHVESYSKGGRKSCPPVIQPSVREDNLINDEINITALAINENKKLKGRKKKDVIKVKILRPKSKKSTNNSTKSVKASISSICTDSGINDTEYGCFHPINESVDLIHNHSETCLHANDCVGDSVEFVENSKSIVTLGDSTHSDNIWDNQYEFNDAQDISPDLFCNNAQEVRSFYNTKLDDFDDCETAYHSPIGTEISSLITEDLSDDLPQPPPIKPNKWHLLSEDETVNTNNASDPSANLASYGANLKQIFPLTCAVPDLSTITERSDDSRKPTLEGITGDGFNSQSILDSNF